MAKKKAPKKPKASASLAAWERYDNRVKEYHKGIGALKQQKAKKAALIKKHSHH
jgi:hypothetical protein